MRTLVVAVVVLFVLCPVAAPAQSIGHPARMLKRGDFNIGLTAAYIIKTDLAEYDLHRTGSDGSSVTRRHKSEFENEAQVMAEAAFGLTNWLNVYGRLGTITDGRLSDNDNDTGDKWQADLGTALVWQVGGRVSLYRFETGLNIVVDASYLRYDNRAVTGWNNQTQGYSVDDYWNTDDSMAYQQFGARLMADWSYGRINLFGGVGYAYGRAEYRGRWEVSSDPSRYTSYNYESAMDLRTNITALAGFEARIVDSLIVGFSANFVSRTAVSLWVGYTF